MRAAYRVFEASGGHGLFLGNPIQRVWRGVHAMRAHAGNNPEAAALVFARSELGLPPNDFRVYRSPLPQEASMVAIRSVAHFSIPVSDVAKSTRFYAEIAGCRHLATVAGGMMAFLDAAGTCLIVVKRDQPINPHPQGHGGVHHAFVIAHDDY